MQVKFKVWDAERGEWNNENIFFIGKCGNLFTVSIGQIKLAHPKFIPVFSTGKTDKNGVELFEGDFDKLRYVVTWCGDNQAGLGMWCGWYFQKNDFDKWREMENGEEKHFEKIGSMYENPELLEK